MSQQVQQNKDLTSKWFADLRDDLCDAFWQIELEYEEQNNLKQSDLQSRGFQRSSWSRSGGGGGQMSLMRGHVFEKVGVNISTVYGQLQEGFRKEVPGAEIDGVFFATGISLVAHMRSPLIPAAHFNTRYIVTNNSWFGGGADLTSIYPDQHETNLFHDTFKEVCNNYKPDCYDKFKRQCDEYFFLKHRNEPRGQGGIFFDYLNTGDFAADFTFVRQVGLGFLKVYPEIIRRKIKQSWTSEQREFQLLKRGRYVEFNLLYDRGTRFGLMTDGNVEAILMSLPPEVKWA
jgi:coproporphyrinogen III oxidase